MIFHNLGSISLVDLVRETDIVYIYVERERHTERQRDQTIRKEVWLDFCMQNLKHML